MFDIQVDVFARTCEIIVECTYEVVRDGRVCNGLGMRSYDKRQHACLSRGAFRVYQGIGARQFTHPVWYSTRCLHDVPFLSLPQ